ncbi:MAG: PAS domain S-box protein [Thermodesulfobacteriota bacterium]
MTDEKQDRVEDKYRALFDQSVEGIYLHDLDGRILDVNRMACLQSGYSREELLGLTVFDLHGDRTNQDDILAQWRQWDDGHRFTVEGEHLHKNGSVYPVEISTGRIRHGDRDLLLAIVRDITERKRIEHQLRESEARFRALFNNAAEGILVADLETRQFVYANPAICRMLGYTEQELTLLGLKDIHPPESLAHTISEFEAQARGEKTLAPDIACRRKDGSVIYADINTARVDLNGREHNIGLFSDVTERRNAERERLRRQKLESLGTIAGGIAHDFNNLLMGVFGNIEMARMGLPDSHPSGRYLDNAGGALERARRLTGQLLTFARGGDPVREVVDVREMVREAVSFHLSGSNVLPHFDLPPDLWPVRADKGQIGQVLANLIINAVQAMPAGGCLHVSAVNMDNPGESRALSPSGPWVRLSIRDEGTGIPAKIIDRIFDPYFTTKQNGSGLGLAVAHGVITRHGGLIRVDSTPDVGTIFTIFFPADPAAAIESPRQVSRAEEPAGRKPRRILFMDDNEAIRKLGVSMLNTFGHSVEVSRDGQDAVAQYTATMEQGSPFDLVILDLTVPGGMGGREAVQKILAVDPGARAIVSSGYSSDPVLSNYRDYGFAGGLVKPFTMAALEAELTRVLADD